jgi:hypothetical protein
VQERVEDAREEAFETLLKDDVTKVMYAAAEKPPNRPLGSPQKRRPMAAKSAPKRLLLLMTDEASRLKEL